MNFAGALRVGCAGWTIPAKFKTQFGEGESHLARYATRFSAVEINSSFYRPHRPATYARWADSTPIDFRFSVKVPKQITHERRLLSVDEEVRSFLVGPRALGAKLGVLLVQLPPSLAFESDVAERFFATLRKETSVAIALEPRHPSWFDPAAEELLLHHAIARVAADPTCVSAAAKPGGDRRWGYYRLHGSPRIYFEL